MDEKVDRKLVLKRDKHIVIQDIILRNVSYALKVKSDFFYCKVQFLRHKWREFCQKHKLENIFSSLNE